MFVTHSGASLVGEMHLHETLELLPEQCTQVAVYGTKFYYANAIGEKLKCAQFNLTCMKWMAVQMPGAIQMLHSHLQMWPTLCPAT